MKKNTFKVSDETLNSHGYKIMTDGIDTTNFEKNPVMYYMHNRALKVIGRWENLKKVNGEMFADAVFDKESNDPLIMEIAGKVERGFLKGASIGISVNEHSNDDNTIITKSELFEISIVDRGSNKNALRLYDNRELFTLQFNSNLKPYTMNEIKEIAKALGLEESATKEVILAKIKTLNGVMENKIQEEKETAKSMVNQAITLGVFDRAKSQDFLNLFDSNFKSAKNTLQSLLDKAPKEANTMHLNSFLESIGTDAETKGENSASKPRAQWTLTDYRKYAPKELQSNPTLYQELIAQEFGE